MIIRTRVTVAIAATSLAAAVLAGCATTTQTGSSTSGPSSSGPSASASAAAATTLATGSTSLGTVVVDGTGLTVYVFDKDTAGSGTSACSGQCAALWPAVESTSTTPTVTGVTGTVGTITGTDGKPQVTLDGMPLYTYASDKAAGDVNGQGVGGIWWAIGADGTKIATKSGY